MPLRVYNTLTRQKEEFQTEVPGQVGMYLCGPTVYKPSHIGHMVGPVIFDTVKRYLVFSGYKVKFVINITDVDDKLIVEASKTGQTVPQVAEAMTKDYFANLQAMNVTTVDVFPYATEHIVEMQQIIQKLIDTGYAYPLEGDVYFDVTKDADYGALSHRSVTEMLAGTRVEANDRKRTPADFALWKGSKPGEPAWDSAWGPGRPGWHIECSAMSFKHIGETLDIHGGGLDLMFPHHENELAQSESCSGKKFSRYWLHNGLMQSGKGTGKVGGAHSRLGDAAPEDAMAEKAAQEQAKISKSTGAGSFRDLLTRHQPETIRFFLLATHYRSPIDYSEEALLETAKTLEGFYRLFELYQTVTGRDFYTLPIAGTRSSMTQLQGEPAGFVAEFVQFRDRFLDAMDDDFNTGGAVGILFEMRKALNGLIQMEKLESTGKTNAAVIATLTTAMTVFRELSTLLGLFSAPVARKSAGDDQFANELMALLLELRTDLRASKNFAFADAIRNKLKALNVVLEDRPDGSVKWKRGE